MSENATRLLLPLLATMREGILIVNSRLDIILYNDAATRIVRLPVKESQSGGGAGRSDDSSYGLLVALPPAAKQGERNAVQQPRLIDATRDPAIKSRRHWFVQQDLIVAKKFAIRESANIEFRAEVFNLFNITNLTSIGTFFLSGSASD
ncbi:MAG TPA: hypothetical protein VK651_06535 [Blastocatellia bacterium]|nr:hypothetical protein [Blastocatellia bacterium]